jgi:hypothetical protein
MYLLLNHEELVIGLARRVLAQHLKKIQPAWTSTNEYLAKMKKKQDKSGLIEIDFATVNECLKKDIQTYYDHVITEYKKKYRPLIVWLGNNFDRVDVNRRYLLDSYINSNAKHFVKTVGQQLTDQPVWTIVGDPVPDNQPVIIRNIINNEALLQHRLANRLPFWFVDSGYTNFITGKKQWHRLVANHIHHKPIKTRYYPADRLHLLASMPAPWRDSGDAILVVENSAKHHELFGTTLDAWRENIIQQLSQHTDREIVFRPKQDDRKTRDNLYQHLMDCNYYCVITDASTSAVEAVWAGIPIITLNRHISTPIACTELSQVNNLYRGPIGNWLCALSYSQFTTKELYNGTALELIEKYHA